MKAVSSFYIHLVIEVSGINVSTEFETVTVLQEVILIYYNFVISILAELNFLCRRAATWFITQPNLQCGEVVLIHLCLFSSSYPISPSESRWEEVKQLERAVFKAALSIR